jgi:hypothetical protein
MFDDNFMSNFVSLCNFINSLAGIQFASMAHGAECADFLFEYSAARFLCRHEIEEARKNIQFQM